MVPPSSRFFWQCCDKLSAEIHTYGNAIFKLAMIIVVLLINILGVKWSRFRIAQVKINEPVLMRSVPCQGKWIPKSSWGLLHSAVCNHVKEWFGGILSHLPGVAIFQQECIGTVGTPEI